LPEMELAVEPITDRFDDDFHSLSRQTRWVAETIDDAEIRTRLIVIADELLDLAYRDKTLH
jgi:hypothetical protein